MRGLAPGDEIPKFAATSVWDVNIIMCIPLSNSMFDLVQNRNSSKASKLSMFEGLLELKKASLFYNRWNLREIPSLPV